LVACMINKLLSVETIKIYRNIQNILSNQG
jgi:hypothetical protein